MKTHYDQLPGYDNDDVPEHQGFISDVRITKGDTRYGKPEGPPNVKFRDSSAYLYLMLGVTIGLWTAVGVSLLGKYVFAFL